MRIDYDKIEPALISRFRQLSADLSQTALAPGLRALVELRVSQINRCSYCIRYHSTQAGQAGEDTSRIGQISEWRTCGLFTPREQAALAWAEALTHTGKIHDDEHEYAQLSAHFSAAEIVSLGLAVSMTNFWNRMAGGFRK